ncbi:MAG: (2Fe-2S)-binding protein [Chloroflexota bacterium]
MQLLVNDSTYEISDNQEGMLLWALRDELGLTGTKFGCGAGICGSCTVHIDGVAQRACITPIATLTEESQIRTIEGLARAGSNGERELHPVQQAFVDHQTPQCGWCMSGQLMQAAAFLDENPTPTDEEISQAMSRNYCRCGCYVRIKSAIRLAADEMTLAGAGQKQTPDTETEVTA